MRIKSKKELAGLVLGNTLAINLLLFCPVSWAATGEDFNRWQNTLAPLYIWGVSMDGTMTSGPVTAPLEVEFSDAISELEGILTIHYEGAKGNWGIIADYSFLNLGPTADIPGTSVAVEVDMENTIAEVAGLYRFGANNPWQLLAGIRRYKLDITIAGLPSPPAPASKITIDETLEDLFFGGRYIQPINDNWSFTGRVDVGSGDSDIVWNAFAAFDYQFTDLLSGYVGWRVLDYEVDKGSGADRFKYDMNHSGPLLALAFHW